jgi:hypothetical protein
MVPKRLQIKFRRNHPKERTQHEASLLLIAWRYVFDQVSKKDVKTLSGLWRRRYIC